MTIDWKIILEAATVAYAAHAVGSKLERVQSALDRIAAAQERRAGAADDEVER